MLDSVAEDWDTAHFLSIASATEECVRSTSRSFVNQLGRALARDLYDAHAGNADVQMALGKSYANARR